MFDTIISLINPENRKWHTMSSIPFFGLFSTFFEHLFVFYLKYLSVSIFTSAQSSFSPHKFIFVGFFAPNKIDITFLLHH